MWQNNLMQTEIGFDLISDLYLSPDESFNWESKPTSLYCLVAGNVSSDMKTVLQTLTHLGRQYQGVFYVPGMLEYETADDVWTRTEELLEISENIPNVCPLHQNVVVIDGIAVIGANGWCESGDTYTTGKMFHTASRREDFNYLNNTIEKLQLHLDIKKIVVLSNAVPHPDLYFGEKPEITDDQIPLCVTLAGDTERKVTHWIFGSYGKNVDTYFGNINFMNNPYLHQKPYWPRRITISI